MDILNEVNFLQYLRKNYPYLYDLEMEIKKVVEATGYGDVSVSCIIRNRKVFSSDVSHWIKRLYEKKS